MKSTALVWQRGITLMELMIVVAIIAMISAFAYPSYQDYIVNTKRTAATTTLLQIADRQQQFFMDNKSYAADLTTLGFTANPLWVADDGRTVTAGDLDAVYIFGIVNVTPTEYLAFAVPVGQQQIRDTKCGALTLNQANARQAYGSQPDDCW
jgi:type IV pilus assembly protein PilE